MQADGGAGAPGEGARAAVAVPRCPPVPAVFAAGAPVPAPLQRLYLHQRREVPNGARGANQMAD